MLLILPGDIITTSTSQQHLCVAITHSLKLESGIQRNARDLQGELDVVEMERELSVRLWRPGHRLRGKQEVMERIRLYWEGKRWKVVKVEIAPLAPMSD